MKNIHRHLRIVLIVFSVMFIALGLYFVYVVNVYGGRWFSNPYNQRLQAQKDTVQAGRLLDRNGEVLAETGEDGERVYNSDKGVRQAVSHVVGDGSGLTSTGAESFMAKYLLGFENNIFEHVYQRLSGGTVRGSDVVLSIDSDLSEVASDAMGSYNGAVVVLNYKTGEVLAMISHPMYDPNDMDRYRNASGDGDEQSALVNRATMGKYTPGSVFKIITAAAALRYLPDADTREWDCEGPLLFDAETRRFLPNQHMSEAEDKALRNQTAAPQPSPTAAATDEAGVGGQLSQGEEYDEGGQVEKYLLLRDYESSYHGEITLKQAFAKSCNNTFARIELEIGEEKLAKMAENFGVGNDFMFSDLVVYASQFVKGSNEYDSAWSAVGQYKDLVTPIHMAAIAGAIGNGGVMMEPKLLRAVVNSRNYQSNMLNPSEYKQVLTADEAAKMEEYMRACITGGTGKSAAVKGVEVCGKTGTAEVSGDKSVANHAWFVGYISGEDHPLAIAVVLEHAGSGGGKAAPVAGKVLKEAVRLGY